MSNPRSSHAQDHLIITVHGIRTFGQWQERLEDMAEAEDDAISVVHYKYGYFSAVAFLVPFLRSLLVRRFARALKQYCKQHSWKRIDIVAHSFGTFLAAKGLLHLKKEDQPRVHTLILAGSVLKVNFPAERLLSSNVTRIVNECGIRDVVLLLSQIVSFGTGMAGRSGIVGLQHETFQNRFYDFKHGGYFDEGGVFMRREWLPLLLGNEPIPRRPYPAALSNTKGALLFLTNNADALKLAVLLSIGIAGVLWYRDTQIANEIVRGFYQGDRRQEYAELWRLSTIQSDRVKKRVVVGLLRDEEGAQKLGDYDQEIATAFGLKPRTFTAIKDILASKPCTDLDRSYFEGCLMIAQTSGDTLAFANRILEVLPAHKWTPAEDDNQNGVNIESYSEQLSGIVSESALEIKTGQPALAARILGVIERFGADDIVATENLLHAMEILFPRLQEADREELADRLVAQLSKADHRYALDLASTLVKIGPTLKGDQLEAAMKRFVDLYEAAGLHYETTGRRDLFQLGELKLPHALSAKQTEEVDLYIEMLRNRLTAQNIAENTALCMAEANLASGGQLAQTRIERGAATTLALVEAITEQSKRAEPTSDRLNSQSSSPMPPERAQLIDAMGTWATVSNGKLTEQLANQLVALTPQDPMLASTLLRLMPKVIDDRGDLGSRISAMLPRLKGTAKVNLALALGAIGAGTQTRHGWADVGFRQIMLELKTAPIPVLRTISGANSDHFSAGQRQQLADQIASLLKTANVDNVGTFADALFNLRDADRRNLQHLQSACDRIIVLVPDGRGGQANSLGGLLAKLGASLPDGRLEDFATELASNFRKAANSAHPMSDPNLVPVHDSSGAVTSYPAWLNLLSTLDGIAAHASLRGNQPYLAVSTLMDLMERACRDTTEAAKAGIAVAEYQDWDTVMVPELAGLVKSLSAYLIPAQKMALANRILNLVSIEIDMAGTVKPLAVNTYLTPSLVDLTSGLDGNQTSLADHIVNLRNSAQGEQRDNLDDALLGLAADADATNRKRILMAIIAEPRSAACDLAVTKAQSGELPFLVDMLKWPICAESRSGIALQIIRIKKADPAKFGRFDTPEDSKSFHLELTSFVAWLKEQRDDAGKPLNLKEPPIFTPLEANQSAVPVRATLIRP